ncbi:MAG: ABC transporter permease [Verrucomicrobiota bacterium]
MTAFIALVRKDLILFLADRRALLMSLVLPIVIGTFFGYLFGGFGAARTSRIDVALVQLDSSEISSKIAACLNADPALRVSEMALGQATQEVRKGKQKAAIVIPSGFGTAAGAALFGPGKKPEIGLLYDPSQQAVLAMVKGTLAQHVMQVVSTEMFGGKTGRQFTDNSLAGLGLLGASDPDSVALRQLLASVQKFQARPQAADRPGKKPLGGLSMPFSTRDEPISSGTGRAGYNSYAHSFAGMGVQFILLLGVDIGIGVLLARRSGIWNRLLAAPVSLNTLLLARAASASLIALGLMCAIFLFAALVFGVRIANPLGFAGVALCFSLLTASFGLLIAAFGKTPEAARGIAVFAALILVMLGGAWVPSFLFPPWVQSLTVAVPTRWAIDGFDAVTWRGLGMDAALISMGVQLAFAVLFGVLALWKFGRDQQ